MTNKKHSDNIVHTSTIALLGTMPDSRLARKFHCHITTIQKIRKRLNIPAYRPAIFWTEDKIKLLGTISDAELGTRLGVSEQVVFKKRAALKISPFRKLTFLTADQVAMLPEMLAVMPDKAIAAKFGVSPDCIRLRRLAMGIKHPPTKVVETKQTR